MNPLPNLGRLSSLTLTVRLPAVPITHSYCSRSSPSSAGTSQGAQAAEVSPGQLDKDRGFSSGASVAFWRDLDPTASGALHRFVADLRGDIAKSPSALPYYAYCFGRTLFYSGQGYLALQNHKIRTSSSSIPTVINAESYLVEAGYAHRDDWLRIAASVHRAPWDASLRHRQFGPLYIARNVARFLRNSQETLDRRAAPEPDTSVWLESSIFPPYYKSTFHFQSDGWLSRASADAYEVSTETLFVGRQDAMQRLALVGIRDQVGENGAVDNAPTVVEIGAGTGRLATFVLDTFPKIHYVLCDLSPFYLAKARENIDYWSQFRSTNPDVRYLHAPAERLPLAEASTDIVIAIYLFHEMPPDARRAAVREAARVLRVGGSFVLVDSIQRGDRPGRDKRLDTFKNFNEPWYSSYVREDFGALFADFGFRPQRKELCSVTKMLTFKKVI